MESRAPQVGPERKLQAVDAIGMALELIDIRSFSTVWYWIAMAALWFSVSHRVMGVPYDLILRARRLGGAADAELAVLARIHAERVLFVAESAPLVWVGLGAFGVTGLGLMAFVYDVEFAQALFCLLFPMLFVLRHRVVTARRIVAGAEGPTLYRSLMQHRRIVQVIGVVAISATALYGTYQNLTRSILN